MKVTSPRKRRLKLKRKKKPPWWSQTRLKP